MTAQTPWKNSAGMPFEPEPPKPEPRKPYPKTLADWMDERLKERMDMREQEKRKMNSPVVPVPEPSAPKELRMGPKDRVEWERNIMRKGYGLAQADLPGDTQKNPWGQALRPELIGSMPEFQPTVWDFLVQNRRPAVKTYRPELTDAYGTPPPITRFGNRRYFPDSGAREALTGKRDPHPYPEPKGHEDPRGSQDQPHLEMGVPNAGLRKRLYRYDE